MSKLIEFPTTELNNLKIAGKRNGVTSLDPILSVAYLAAMWTHLHHHPSFTPTRSTSDPSQEGPRQESGSVHFRLGSSRDERPNIADLKPSYCGNYFTGIFWSLTTDPTTSFWSTARAYQTFTRDPKTLQYGRDYIGNLPFIPKPWEQEWIRLLNLSHPFPFSLTLSNLTFVELPSGSDDLVRSHFASPFLLPLVVNLMGHRNGLRAMAVWREGSPLYLKDVEEIQRIWVKTLSKIGTEKGDELCFKDIEN